MSSRLYNYHLRKPTLDSVSKARIEVYIYRCVYIWIFETHSAFQKGSFTQRHISFNNVHFHEDYFELVRYL